MDEELSEERRSQLNQPANPEESVEIATEEIDETGEEAHHQETSASSVGSTAIGKNQYNN